MQQSDLGILAFSVDQDFVFVNPNGFRISVMPMVTRDTRRAILKKDDWKYMAQLLMTGRVIEVFDRHYPELILLFNHFFSTIKLHASSPKALVEQGSYNEVCEDMKDDLNNSIERSNLTILLLLVRDILEGDE